MAVNYVWSRTRKSEELLVYSGLVFKYLEDKYGRLPIIGADDYKISYGSFEVPPARDSYGQGENYILLVPHKDGHAFFGVYFSDQYKGLYPLHIYGNGDYLTSKYLVKVTRWYFEDTTNNPNGGWSEVYGDVYEIDNSYYSKTVKSTNRNAYPDNGDVGNYTYKFLGVDNQPPTISGSNLDLGSKQDDFEIEYTVSDADKNPCTVDIVVDTVKKISSKSVVLNTKYTYPVRIDEFSLGKHTITITAKDSNGATTSRKYTFTKSNTAPIISGSDTDLGERSTAFTEEYSVTDRNNDNVDITVTLDDLEISNISSAQNKSLSFTISNEQLEKFEIGSSHTITIKADDGKGGVAYRRYTFIKANRPPIISDTDKDLGQKKESFSINYSLSDVEKDKIYTRIYLDNKQVFENLEVEDGKSYKFIIEKDVFLSLNYGKHEIRIEAWDDNSVNNKQVRTYTFERVQNGLTVEIKINEFDIQPKKIIAVPHGIFASDATITVLACNNFNDASPKWEAITESSKAARAYSFTNTTKTASKWAIGVVIKVENGKSGVSSVLRGVKGGYE